MFNPKIFLFLLTELSCMNIAQRSNSGLISSNLSGKHFVIATLFDPPYVEFQNEGGILKNIDGCIPQTIKWLAIKHRFSYHFIEPTDKAYGAKVNGTWNGVVGCVYRGDVDMGAANVVTTYERYSIVDFTYAFANDRMVFLVPYPRLASKMSSIIRPFQFEVWVGVVLSLPSIAVILFLIEKTANRTVYKKSGTSKGILSNLWFLFRSFTNSGGTLELIHSTKILVAFWSLAVFVLVQSYNSCLVSYLTTPKFVPVANTIEDMANSPELSLVVLKFTSIEPAILGATYGPLVKLGNKLRAHPENAITSYKNIAEIVASKPSVAPFQEGTVSVLLNNDWIRTKECRISIAKEYLFENRLAFVMPKSTRHITHIFSKDLIFLQQTGLFIYWTKSFNPRPNRCTAQLSLLRPPTALTKLSLNFLSGVFMVYVFGGSLSIIVFLLECLVCQSRKTLQYRDRPQSTVHMD